MSNKNTFGQKGWTPDRIKSLKGKTYLITGATSGTGFEAAKILASKGGKVMMLNRNQKKIRGLHCSNQTRAWQQGRCKLYHYGLRFTIFCKSSSSKYS